MLYERPVRELMREAVAAMPDVFRGQDIIDWFAIQYPLVKATTVRTHVTAATVNHPSSGYTSAGVPDLIWRRPDGRLERYRPGESGTEQLEALEEESATPPESKGEFTGLARETLSRSLGTTLDARVLKLTGGVTQRFDLVSEDRGASGWPWTSPLGPPQKPDGPRSPSMSGLSNMSMLRRAPGP